MNPLDVQVGGNHYKGMKIQPVQFINHYALPHCTGNVTKYLTRNKGKRLEDLEKAYHYIDLEVHFSILKDKHPSIKEHYYKHYLKDPFFSQFKNGRKYAQILFYLRMGNKPKAKELLRKFINSGNYSEV